MTANNKIIISKISENILSISSLKIKNIGKELKNYLYLN
jgi:hypothetical protein